MIIRNIARRTLPVMFLLLATMVFHRGVLFDRGLGIPWDMRTYHLPLAAAYADALAERVLPLWEPYSYAGRPLLANPETAVFYPGVLLAALPGREGLYYRLEVLSIFHVFLAGWFTYLLARRLGLGRNASLLAGLIFELGGLPASQMQHLGLICGAPWFVLAWLALFLPSRWTVPMLAMALTLNFFMGFTAVTVMVGASTFVLACLLWAFGKADHRLLARVGLASVLAAALAAVQWFPSLELVRNSVGQYRTDWLAGGRGIPPAALVSLVWPDYWGVFNLRTFKAPYELTMLYLYAGACTLPLAISALIRQRGACMLVAIAGTFSAFLMLGSYTPLGRILFAAAPAFLKNTIYWYPWMVPFLLCLALLAAHGAEVWVKRPVWIVVLALLTTIDLVAVSSGRPFNMERITNDPLVTEQSIDGSAELYQQLRDTTGDYRYEIPSNQFAFVSGSPVLRLRTGNGYDPLALERLIQVRLGFAKGERWGAYYAVEDTESPAVDLLSIRALLVRAGEHAPGSNWVVAAKTTGWSIYRNDQALARYRLVGRVHRTANLAESASWLHRRTFDPAVEAIAEGFELETGSTGTVRVLNETRQAIALETEAAGPSFLVTSEVHYPGWEARVDGAAAPTFYANVAFRGVPLPPGRHRVDMFFRQRGLWGVAAISLAAGCVWLGLIFSGIRSARSTARH